MEDNLHTKIIRSLEEVRSVRPIWEKVQAREAHPRVNTDIDRYLSLIQANTQQTQPYIILVKRNNITISLLIGYINISPIQCNLGRKTLFKPSLKKLNIVYSGLLGNADRDVCCLLIENLIQILSSREADVVFFNHLDINSELYKMLRKKPRIFCRDFFPKVESHWYMLIPQDFVQFLRTCSHNRRRNYKRWTKRFEKQFQNQVKIETYSQKNEVDLALEKITYISSHTYQRAFGGGVVNNFKTKALYNNAAEKGWLQTYVLSLNDEPCAFWTGLKYAGTFFAEHTGFLPKFREFHVGTVLFFKVVEDMCKDPEVDSFDFSFGDGQHKQWGESKSRSEASVCIFAPRLYPILVNMIFSLTTATSRSIEYAVKKMNLIFHIQKYRRYLAMRKAGQSMH